MTISAPRGLSINTSTGLISGTPIPDYLVVDFGSTHHESSYAGSPVWDPGVQVLPYFGFGNDPNGSPNPGYHAWGFRQDSGAFSLYASLRWNPTTGDLYLVSATYLTADLGGSYNAIGYSKTGTPIGTWNFLTFNGAYQGATTWPSTVTSAVSGGLGTVGVGTSTQWRLLVVDPGLMGTYDGLIINEVGGYESTDGSGTNVFDASQGTTCTGTPGYTYGTDYSIAIDGNITDSVVTYCAIGSSIGQWVQFTLSSAKDIKSVKVWTATGTRYVVVRLQSYNGSTWVDRSGDFTISPTRPTLITASTSSLPAPTNFNVTISATNATGSDTKTLNMAVFDPTLWVGFWDLDADLDNRVTGDGGAFTDIGYTGYALGPLTSPGHDGTGNAVAIVGDWASSYERGCTLAAPKTLSKFTFGGFVLGYYGGLGPAFRTYRAVNDNVLTVQYVTASGDFAIGGSLYSIPLSVYDYGWHHVALSWSGDTGETKVYLDGVIASTTITATGTVDVAWFGADGGYYDWISGQMDNLFLYGGILSASAIAALATGNVPNPDGSLP